VLGLLWYRGEYQSEKASRIADRTAEQAKVLEAQQKAQALSDELVIQQATPSAIEQEGRFLCVADSLGS